MQFVHLVEGGERGDDEQARAASSSRSTTCIDDIGVDAARCFLLARSHDTTIDLDLDLARSQSSENPVYYVQYAHARIASVLRKAGEERVAQALAGARRRPGVGLHPSERALIRRLLAFPDEVAEAADRRAPHRIAAYALELGAGLHRLLPRLPGRGRAATTRNCCACGSASRPGACSPGRLDLLGVAAPEEM